MIENVRQTNSRGRMNNSAGGAYHDQGQPPYTVKPQLPGKAKMLGFDNNQPPLRPPSLYGNNQP